MGQKPGQKHILKAAVSDDMVEKVKNISSSDSRIHTMLEHQNSINITFEKSLNLCKLSFFLPRAMTTKTGNFFVNF